jgi:DNA-binding transcriptional ArsR family regulator
LRVWGRVVVASLILAAAIAVVPARMAAPQGILGGRLVFVVTDPLDEEYIQALLSRYAVVNTTPRLITDLNGLLAMELDPAWDVVVLVDPNWGPGDVQTALGVSEKLWEFIEDGGVVVSTLNGVVLLRLSKPFLPGPQDSCPGIVYPPRYNVSKYECIPRPPGSVEEGPQQGAPSIYLLGGLVIVPFNVVWAYLDTHDAAYLTLLLRALTYTSSVPRVRESHRGAEILAGATLAAGLIASRLASGGGSQGAHHRSGATRRVRAPPIAPLYPRIDPSHAPQHSVRGRILELVRERGAATLPEILKELGLAKAVASWHLYVLTRSGLLHRVRYKKCVVYYLNYKDLIRYLAERDKAFCRLVGLLASGASIEEAARALRVRPEGLRQVADLLSLEAVLEVAVEACRG